MAVCSYLMPDGGRCRAAPMKGEAWCYVHHPDLAEKRRAASRRGGYRAGRGRPAPGVAEVEAIKASIRKVIDGVAAGTVENGRFSSWATTRSCGPSRSGARSRIRTISKCGSRARRLRGSAQRKGAAVASMNERVQRLQARIAPLPKARPAHAAARALLEEDRPLPRRTRLPGPQGERRGRWPPGRPGAARAAAAADAGRPEDRTRSLAAFRERIHTLATRRRQSAGESSPGRQAGTPRTRQNRPLEGGDPQSRRGQLW